jgi:hypothetical protein
LVMAQSLHAFALGAGPQRTQLAVREFSAAPGTAVMRPMLRLRLICRGRPQGGGFAAAPAPAPACVCGSQSHSTGVSCQSAAKFRRWCVDTPGTCLSLAAMTWPCALSWHGCCHLRPTRTSLPVVRPLFSFEVPANVLRQ